MIAAKEHKERRDVGVSSCVPCTALGQNQAIGRSFSGHEKAQKGSKEESLCCLRLFVAIPNVLVAARRAVSFVIFCGKSDFV
jgi:hypothetical protein